MILVDLNGSEDALDTGDVFPREVEFVISALEAGPRPAEERQQIKRTRYRVKAWLKLFSDGADAPPTLLFTRHVNPQAIGFLSARRLPLSYGGVLMLRSPSGEVMQISCTVLRCREAAPGWYEGAVYFNRAQQSFAAEEMEEARREAEEEEVGEGA